MTRVDLNGQKFGLLRPFEFLGGPSSTWRCQCSCGRTHEVASVCLRDGRSRSCGCLKRIAGFIFRTFASERISWAAMLSRCQNTSHKNYAKYGGRGITVCERWSGNHGFLAFLGDMGQKPTPAHTIDRRDNTKGYEPDNCRWATPKEQAANRCNNTVATINGDTKTVPEWCRITGVPVHIAGERLRRGWTPQRALFTAPLK